MQNYLGEIVMKYYVGVDIGTTSTKSVLFDKFGNVVSSSYREYPLYSEDVMTAEQDPYEILQAVIDTINEVVKLNEQDIEFVSFSSAMHSLIAVNQEGTPITKCITWADKRASDWSDKIKFEMNGLDIHRRTGTPIHPMSPLSKIIWLKNEHQDIFDKTYKFIGIKEFVLYHFFEEYVIDYSIASATGLFNLETLTWDDEVLKLLGISEEKLSRIVPTTMILKNLNTKYIKLLGLNEETKFVVGASDGVLSNLGVNAVEKGVVAVTIGTSGAVRTVVDHPIVDEEGKTFCYALTENHWVVGGAVNNGGITLKWLNDIIIDDIYKDNSVMINPYNIITEIASSVPAGSEGLLFHPYLTGERAPLWNANARASFFGLSIHHQRKHMIRAVLEGVLFNLYDVVLVLQKQIGEITKIQATGGFARSAVWRQMMADVFQVEVIIPEVFESSCLGAVILGMYATKEIDNLNEVSNYVGKTFEHEPNKENVQVYQKLYPIYQETLSLLEKGYYRIAEFQKNSNGKV